MTSSFVVNVHDLEFILRQIKIADAHASGISLRQAIMNEYQVSATEAALLPFGLRTVDGRFNNLLASNVDYGASDTPFPRLTTPVYNNENDEDPFFGVTNTNYGNPGNVVDSDPRTISNLIVDQTAANPAAILAALKVNGIEGDAAMIAQAAITAAYNATLTAGPAASAAFLAAQSALNSANARLGPTCACRRRRRRSGRVSHDRDPAGDCRANRGQRDQYRDERAAEPPQRSRSRSRRDAGSVQRRPDQSRRRSARGQRRAGRADRRRHGASVRARRRRHPAAGAPH